MAYQPLARTYRPGQFAELVGQEAVAQALGNALHLQREPHAVIFTGVRGVGKTTVARLYAKALNCPVRSEQASGEPCNACASCLAINRGNHEDVLEIDGASNTGVADVRQLQETIDYRPQRSRFKVYIIDEVHMLSGAAFNALLKTLEEPPSHVVFIFATTEIHKVPQTIMSRCQAFYLKKLPAALIHQRLAEILTKEQVPFEAKALTVIAREGHGSLRDALTLLDQAIALGQGKVQVASLSWLVSNLSTEPYLELLDALTQRNAARALEVVAAFDQAGVDFVAVAETAAQLARHAFVIQGVGMAGLEVALLGLDDAELARLQGIAQAAGAFDLNRIFRTLVKCRADFDGSALDRCILENYLCEWCLDPGFPALGELMAAPSVPLRSGADSAAAVAPGGAKTSPAALGAALRSAAQATRPASSAPTAPITLPAPVNTAAPTSTKPQPPLAAPPPRSVAPAPAPEQPPAPPQALQPSLPAAWRELVDLWKQQKPLQARKLEEAHPIEYSPERIVLAISEVGFAGRSLLNRDEQAKIKEQFRELFGFAGTLLIQAKGTASAPASQSQPEPPALPDTILTQRGREAAGRRERLLDEARNAPFTRDLLSSLGGQLEDVRIQGSDEHPAG